MPQGLQIFDASGRVVFDTNDRLAGGVVVISTGTASGSHTMTPGAGQSVEYVYNYPNTWIPAGQASRWPDITVSGNTITWAYNSAVPVAQRMPVTIYGVTY